MSQQSPLDNHAAEVPPDLDQPADIEASIVPEGESPFGPSPQPRLGIIHIMLWTAGSAMILAMYRALIDLANMPDQARVQWYVMQIGYSIVYGAALAGVILFGYRRLTKGAPFPVLPGHWLLLTWGIVFIVGSVGHAVQWAVRVWFDSYPPLVYGLAQWLSHTVAASILLVAIIRVKDSSYWRMYLWASLVLQLIQADAGLMQVPAMTMSFYLLQRWIYGLSAAVLVPWLLVTVARDWRRSVRRDWLHWTGIVVTLSGPVLFAIYTLWSLVVDWTE